MGCGSASESRELKTVVVLVLRISRGRVSDGPGRSRTCDLGIKSPAGTFAANSSGRKVAAMKVYFQIDGQTFSRVVVFLGLPIEAVRPESFGWTFPNAGFMRSYSAQSRERVAYRA